MALRGKMIACLAVALAVLGALPLLQAKSCAELGFTASLLCSSCQQLAAMVPDEGALGSVGFSSRCKCRVQLLTPSARAHWHTAVRASPGQVTLPPPAAPRAELVAECRKCCAEDAVESDTRVFVSALLEFCPHSLRGYPHLETFVEKIAPDVENLALRFALPGAQERGSRPAFATRRSAGLQVCLHQEQGSDATMQSLLRRRV